MKKINFQTHNKEIYKKFNMLNIVPEVVIENTSIAKIKDVVKAINKKNNNVETKVLSNNMILVKKKQHDANFNIYLR